MPKTLLITAFNHTLYEAYAHRFLDTYLGELDLCIVSEDVLPEMRGIHTLRLQAHQHFVNMNSWRPPPSFKQDAVRFCYKPYSIWTAYHEHKDTDYTGILWLDADTVFHKQITEEWVQENLATEGIMSYMGRPNYHSETGVLYFNTKNTATAEYLEAVLELYNTNEIYTLDETHDSYIWDYVRVKFAKRKNQQRNNTFRDLAEHITEPVRGGHIQATLYGEYWDHLKGKRKQQGYSEENKYAQR